MFVYVSDICALCRLGDIMMCAFATIVIVDPLMIKPKTQTGICCIST